MTGYNIPASSTKPFDNAAVLFYFTYAIKLEQRNFYLEHAIIHALSNVMLLAYHQS